MSKQIKVNEIQPGHFFSEETHYKAVGSNGKSGYVFENTQSGEEVILSNSYVESFLSSSDQFHDIQIIGKEDKLWTQARITKEGTGNERVGDIYQAGIRTIFENIYSAQVFGCMFLANSKETKKSLDARKQEQIELAVEAILKAKAGKQSMSNEAAKQLKNIQDNPIVLEPRERVLKGYKTQFTSRDGRYQCMDLDINELRPVNINTLQWLCVNGVLYITEEHYKANKTSYSKMKKQLV